jgi:hypothetical protein
MLLPTRVVVCARRGLWGAPDTGARDQYMPDEGAAGTSAAVEGSCRGGKGVYAPRGCRAGVDGLRGAVVGMASEEGLVAMADVVRMTKGRRESESLPSVEDPACGSF